MDASDFTPFIVSDDDVSYSTGDSDVQKSTTYIVNLTSPVPLEVLNWNCYIKYTFPIELNVVESELTSYTADGLLKGADSSTKIQPVFKSLSGDTKSIIFKGCHDSALQGSTRPNSIIQNLNFVFSKIRNPYSVRTTSPLIIQVFKEWSAATGPTKQIIEARKPISASLFKQNLITSFSMSATNKIV